MIIVTQMLLMVGKVDQAQELVDFGTKNCERMLSDSSLQIDR